jgi:phage major head subunit gpT-like protein
MARITDYGVKSDLYNRLAQFNKSKGLLALALMLSSNLPEGQSELYAWLGTTPSMRQWIGQRQQNDPQAFSMAITNKKFENSLKMPLSIVNNDKTDQAVELLSSLASSYPLWKTELIAALVSAGTTTKCFDGANFFANSHSFGSSGSFNNIANTATNGNAAKVTPLEAASAINLGIELMKAYPDDQGRAIKNEDMTKVVLVYTAGTVNASSIRTALNTVNDGVLASGSGSVNNPLTGQDVSIVPVASGLITTGNTVFSLFRAREDLGKSIIFQENETDEMVSMITGTNDEYVIFNDAWFVGLRTVGNTGYGLPNDAIQMTFV